VASSADRVSSVSRDTDAGFEERCRQSRRVALTLETRSRRSHWYAGRNFRWQIVKCDEAALRRAPFSRGDLFSTLAPQKFLRSEQTELAHIASLPHTIAWPIRIRASTAHGPVSCCAYTVDSERERVYQVFAAPAGDLVNFPLPGARCSGPRPATRTNPKRLRPSSV